MKQKYEIVINQNENKVVIREFAQLDKEIMSLLCQESFDGASIQAAVERGDTELLYAALRSNNMYPPAIYMEGIAQKVTAMLNEKASGPEEVVFDDLEFLSSYVSVDLDKDIVGLDKDDDSLDTLLEPVGFEDVDDVDDFDDKDGLDKIGDTLKVDDTEFSDIDAD